MPGTTPPRALRKMRHNNTMSLREVAASLEHGTPEETWEKIQVLSRAALQPGSDVNDGYVEDEIMGLID